MPGRLVEPIRTYGAACLRRRAEPAAVGAPETADLLDRMWATLRRDGGVGLAAPQIGVNQRVVVIRNPERPARDQRLDLVNPVLTTTFGEQAPFEEGCLSFPGLYFKVWRASGAVVEFLDRDGRPCRLSDEGLLARIVLHEIDHLDGVLYIDRVGIWQRLGLLPRLLWFRLTGHRGN